MYMVSHACTWCHMHVTLQGHVSPLIAYMQVASETMLCQVIHWMRVDDSTLGVVQLAGTPVAQELGRPMMLLNVLTEFCGSDQLQRMKYTEDFDWAVAAILKHVRVLSMSEISIS